MRVCYTDLVLDGLACPRVHEVLYAAGDMIGTYMRLILHYVKPSCTVMTLNDDESSIGEPESNVKKYV